MARVKGSEINFVGPVKRLTHSVKGFSIAHLNVKHGKIEDGEGHEIRLPCPPYCEKNIMLIKEFRKDLNGSILIENVRVEDEGYSQEMRTLHELENGPQGFLQVRVLYGSNRQEYDAFVGIDEQGKIMQGDDHEVVVMGLSYTSPAES